MFNNFLKDAIILIVVTSCLPLAVCSVNSFLVAIFQTATQIQEQTLTYIVKLTSIIVVYYFCGEWFFAEYLKFFEISFSSLKIIGTIR